MDARRKFPGCPRAEADIHAEGGHGFGIRKHALAVDTWLDRFVDALESQGLGKPKA